jgi:hypothetical protein
VVAGTDTPNAVNMHGELMSYTMAGMSAFDALKTATVNPAKALGLNAGTISGKYGHHRGGRRSAREHAATPACAMSSERAAHSVEVVKAPPRRRTSGNHW